MARGYNDGHQSQDGRQAAPETFEFVYIMPDFVEPDFQPRNLRQITRGTNISKPSISDRVDLAQALANSPLFILTLEWFGKSARSANFIFFPKSNGNVDYSSERMQCGYDYFERKEVATREFHTISARG